MELIYRGIRYSEEDRQNLTIVNRATKEEVIYRGNSLRARINPKFPWLRYVKQLFRKSESKPIIDPIAFWYDHKREFIENCWRWGDLQKLDLAWDLTLEAERAKAQKLKPKTKLKYRGVTYYR